MVDHGAAAAANPQTVDAAGDSRAWRDCSATIRRAVGNVAAGIQQHTDQAAGNGAGVGDVTALVHDGDAVARAGADGRVRQVRHRTAKPEQHAVGAALDIPLVPDHGARPPDPNAIAVAASDDQAMIDHRAAGAGGAQRDSGCHGTSGVDRAAVDQRVGIG
ncbi:hypothetical protein D3C72_1612350 [compost metagenome]